MAERKIAGRVFRVSPLPASEAIALYAELIAALGAAVHRLPAIIVSATADESEQNVMGDMVALAAITDIVKSATPGGCRDLIKRIVEVAQIQRPSGAYEPIDLDGDFTGRLNDIVEVVKFVLKEQYSDFFTGSGVNGLLGRLREALLSRKPLGSPQT